MSERLLRLRRAALPVLLLAGVAAVLFAGGSKLLGQAAAKKYPILGPCSGSLLIFSVDPTFAFGDPVENAKRKFHSTVAKVVEEHLRGKNIQCAADVVDAPTAELSAIAKNLHPWRDAEDLAKLEEADIGAVLLEYLRVYECHMKEHEFFVPIRIKDEPNQSTWSFLKIFMQRTNTISEERVFARKAVHRMLSILGGLDRLRPLEVNLECLQRASLDIRNIFGLAADAASCIPRVWDARGSLRDLPPTP